MRIIRKIHFGHGRLGNGVIENNTSAEIEFLITDD
jgi:hypothetical protein